MKGGFTVHNGYYRGKTEGQVDKKLKTRNYYVV